MNFIYWLTFVLGGGMFALSFAGELFGAHGGAHLGAHTDLTSDSHGNDFDWGKLFSLRNLTYLLFAFGATGVVLSFAWQGERDLLTALTAAATGGAAWVMSALVFNYLRRTESGALQGDQHLVGRIGQIVLPISRGGTGKVLVARAGQTQELLARPLDEKEPGYEGWDTVVIVEIRDGVALVTPYSEQPH